jgi:CDP-paratose 2-epimerase
MVLRQILVTGGAGFVGANLAVLFKRAMPAVKVTCFDNLKRRGSELNLPRLREHGVAFLHGDVRCTEDLDEWPPFDLLIDCSAEPSVQAGLCGSPMPVVQNNLTGTLLCAEAARRRGAALLFLSTSRVYPIGALNRLAWRETETRFEWTAEESLPGLSARGIAEEFSLEGPRSLYGGTKLAAEILLREFAAAYQMPVLINRCGILTGPWQMGKVDQGVVMLWVACHHFGVPLRYLGFGGQGKQVRDMLHVEDLFDLLWRQTQDLSRWDGRPYNVGGGREISASLAELTALCRRQTGREAPIAADPATSPVDLRIYLSDYGRAARDFSRMPQRGLPTILEDLHAWIRAHEEALRSVLFPQEALR